MIVELGRVDFGNKIHGDLNKKSFSRKVRMETSSEDIQERIRGQILEKDTKFFFRSKEGIREMRQQLMAMNK